MVVRQKAELKIKLNINSDEPKKRGPKDKGQKKFVADTAKATGRSKMSVRRDKSRGEKIAKDVQKAIAGTDIEDAVPRHFSLAVPGNSGYINVLDKDFDVYLTTPATKDILAGPIALTTALGDVVHFAILDNVDPDIVDLLKYEHLAAAP